MRLAGSAPPDLLQTGWHQPQAPLGGGSGGLPAATMAHRIKQKIDGSSPGGHSSTGHWPIRDDGAGGVNQSQAPKRSN